MTPLARSAGHALAVAALVVAFAAAAQGPVYDPRPAPDGFLPWLFAAVVGVAVVGVFLFVLWLVQLPDDRSPGAPGAPGARRGQG